MTNQQHSFDQSQIVLNDSQINSLAGATSGIFVSILVSPLDVVKTRIQVNPLPKGASSTPFYVVMYRLAQQEGFKALYKGLGTAMLGYVPNWAVYFTAYQWSKKHYASFLKSLRLEHDIWTNLCASVTAGAISNIVIAPMWTVRTRMMTQINHENYRNSFHAIKKIYQTEGIHALYRGLIPSMFGLIHVGIQFPMYEYLKKKSSEFSHDHRLSTGQLIFASSTSKLLASCIAYPHEVVRSRLQDAGHARHVEQQQQQQSLNSHEYKNVRHALQSIIREEGLRGFYRGLQATLVRTVPAAVLTLLSYEKMREFLSDNFSDKSFQ